MEYRIVQRENGYMPQYKKFFLWWDFYYRWAPCKTLEYALKMVNEDADRKLKFNKVVWRSEE